ncbi:MAG: component of SufBCD complex [Alphaproteobacteria bacterium HGW-Alphaproteobacteria-6]|nr:MAG: component of SufBCD complex [Alphaproteobacteria bacterium HGW-Alphaproteobacteria-6]
MDWTRLLLDLIDLRSFSNLWYWIALAVTWSSASHWVLGIPYDMVLRAKRLGGGAAEDLDAIARINITRMLYIVNEAGLILIALACFALTTLALLGFIYRVEFCQAVFLLVAPLFLVALLSLMTARRIAALNETGEALHRRLALHRIAVQVLGMISIFLTAFWGMLQNFNVSILGG